MMLSEKLRGKKIILASQSPRRQQLLKNLEVEFSIETRDVDERFSNELKREEVALYLAQKKATAFGPLADADTIVITSDTIVCLDDDILNKPADKAEAMSMLQRLSGREHQVITAVCLRSVQKTHAFFETTTVRFKPLKADEIEHYIDTYQPFDKAGSYGIQEWIGYVGVAGIDGCFFNVMGLPLHRLNAELLVF